MTSTASVEINASYVPTAVSNVLLTSGSADRSRQPPGAVKLGELYRPPSAALTFPDSERLISAARDWLLRHIEPLGCSPRLVRPLDETVTMCAYLFPDADYEGIFLATAFTVLEFVEDDIFDSIDVYDAFCATGHGQRLAAELLHIRANPRILGKGMWRIVELIRNPESFAAALTLSDVISGELFLFAAFGEFAHQLQTFGRRTASPNFSSWLARFTDALIHFSSSHLYIYEAVEELSVEEYAAHKLVNCGMLHTVHLLELAMGCFLSPEQHAHPLIEALKRHCTFVGSLLNEITSYEKEVFQERSGNLLLVVMLKEHCDLGQAAAKVAALAQIHADAVVRLRALVDQEFSGADEPSRLLRRYARGIERLTASCWYWQLEGTTRYKSPTSPFAELLV